MTASSSASGSGPRLVAVLVLLAALAASGAWACLITNCPRGGKRASAGLHRPREMQCSPCGPGGDGYCVGPGICCSPLFGCVLAAQGTCSRAVTFPPHCSPPGVVAVRLSRTPPVNAPCGADLTPDGSAPGRCAAQGVCCTQDSCRLDAVCLAREDNDLPGSGFDADLMPPTGRQLGSDDK